MVPVMARTDTTTIQVTRDTREELKALGSKGETYDEIIKRLIKIKEECAQK